MKGVRSLKKFAENYSVV